MESGTIVTVDWRDAMLGTGEPNNRRPGIVVTSKIYLGVAHPFEFVVPITGSARLAIDGASTRIDPTTENGCTKVCYALSWNSIDAACAPRRNIIERLCRYRRFDTSANPRMPR
jgi:hypothetical protein